MPGVPTLVRLVSCLVAFACLSRAGRAAPTQADSLSPTTVELHLRRFEGYRTVPYRDGPSWSVGVGHNLSAHREPVKARYTDVEIRRFLLADTAAALDACRLGVTGFDDLPVEVQLVCIDLAFTTGSTGFQRWGNLRLALGRRAYSSAAIELTLSRWWRQVSAERANWALRALRAQP